MRNRLLLPAAALLAAIGALAGCSDEKKGEPSQMSKPAPPADPSRPEGQKIDPPKPGTEQPMEKH